jgi:hypothetical protein
MAASSRFKAMSEQFSSRACSRSINCHPHWQKDFKNGTPSLHTRMTAFLLAKVHCPSLRMAGLGPSRHQMSGAIRPFAEVQEVGDMAPGPYLSLRVADSGTGMQVKEQYLSS